jgi:hypothetical protein
VGSHVLDVTLAGDKLQGGPLVAKAYNSALIKVSDVSSGIVGQPCQFKGEISAESFSKRVIFQPGSIQQQLMNDFT